MNAAGLSFNAMARALGMWRAFYGRGCDACGSYCAADVFLKLDQGDRGGVVRAVCGACLPAEYAAAIASGTARDPACEGLTVAQMAAVLEMGLSAADCGCDECKATAGCMFYSRRTGAHVCEICLPGVFAAHLAAHKATMGATEPEAAAFESWRSERKEGAPV